MMAVPPPSFQVLDPAAALHFWYERVNYEQRSARPGDLKLDRMRQLLTRLGDPHLRLRVLHVAGTKGKGSTSALLGSIFQHAGYRTGLFTSPHLSSVNERFQVDGQPITEGELTYLLSEIRAAVSGLADVTFFEICTAVGFLHFVRRRVDVAVLEVGLGGRFDSTNVCLPEVALITSISFDHTKQLGNTLASIAFEKAGIVKPGRPTVSGVVNPEARTVIEEVCRQRRSPLIEMDRDIHVEYRPGQVREDKVVCPVLTVTTPRGTWADLELNLLGRHQAANAAVAVAAIEILQERGWPIRAEAVREGVASVCWPARMEILRHRPLVVVDCAHNVASAEAVVRTLQESFPPTRRVLVFASSNDKDVVGMARVLAPHFAAVVATRFTTNSRAVTPEQILAIFAQAGLSGTTAATPAEAWEQARRLAGEDELVCVAGSVFLAGEMRAILTAA
jgi:dihydrofolate synthase/folylpolyglutamate synthase